MESRGRRERPKGLPQGICPGWGVDLHNKVPPPRGGGDLKPQSYTVTTLEATILKSV